jgi:hypothetical protein
MLSAILLAISLFFPLKAVAQATTLGVHEITTNAAIVHDAPRWLTDARVERVTDKIQNVLEWDIRRVTVKFYSDAREFSRAHGLNVTRDASSTIMAVSRKSDNTIHVGPLVDNSNFDGIFGHELGHIIMFQKYKDAIPTWLEEGLANFASKHGQVDYKWLAKQPSVDLKTMGHPFGNAGPGPRYHYMSKHTLVLIPTILLVVLALAAGCASQEKKFERVVPGMSASAVQKNLGGPTRFGQVADTSFSTWYWGDEYCVLFRDDKVVAKDSATTGKSGNAGPASYEEKTRAECLAPGEVSKAKTDRTVTVPGIGKIHLPESNLRTPANTAE